MIIYLGCDPDSHGAIAAMTEGGEVLEVIDLSSDDAENARQLARVRFVSGVGEHVVAAIEDQRGIPGQSTNNACTLGKRQGFVTGYLMAQGYTVLTIPPNTWKRQVPGGSLIQPKGSTSAQRKDAAIHRVMALHPKLDLSYRGQWGAARAEAILLAHVARLTWTGHSRVLDEFEDL